MDHAPAASPVRTAIEIAVYLLLIFAVLAWCLQIIRPFIGIIMWAVVIAVACHPLFLKLQNALGGRRKLAAIAFALIGLAVIVVPAWLFADSLISSAGRLSQALDSGALHIPPANESVHGWPVIGPALYENWSAAATNLSEWLNQHREEVTAVLGSLAGRAANAALSVLQFLASTLIATIMLASATAATQAMQRITDRLVGAGGADLLTLSTATIRSVAVGVLGIAAIQAVAAGFGMALMGVPAAGVWALVILVLAIAQLPPLLVLLPVILYVFSTSDHMVANVVFTAWSVLIAVSDSFLKPMLLGRGVQAPMLVILLGAIGGMLHSGIIGLFLGAVVLALGYNLFQSWLTGGPTSPEQART